MRQYNLEYLDRTINTVKTLSVKAKSINQAILQLRLKGLKFRVLKIETN